MQTLFPGDASRTRLQPFVLSVDFSFIARKRAMQVQILPRSCALRDNTFCPSARETGMTGRTRPTESVVRVTTTRVKTWMSRHARAARGSYCHDNVIAQSERELLRSPRLGCDGNIGMRKDCCSRYTTCVSICHR